MQQKQLDVRGCGGWIKLNCDGGSLDIQKVSTGSLVESCHFYYRSALKVLLTPSAFSKQLL